MTIDRDMRRARKRSEAWAVPETFRRRRRRCSPKQGSGILALVVVSLSILSLPDQSSLFATAANDDYYGENFDDYYKNGDDYYNNNNNADAGNYGGDDYYAGDDGNGDDNYEGGDANGDDYYEYQNGNQGDDDAFSWSSDNFDGVSVMPVSCIN